MIYLQKSHCFTCRDMLMLDSMAGSILLAGENNLDSRILRVNTVEVPDIINWVGEREMLITTGYPFKDDKERIAQMIPQLVAKNVVGMAIKPKRFIDEIPQSVIETAKKYDFIVISLSKDAVFSSIVRESLEQILAKEMVMMTTAHSVTEKVIAAAVRSSEDARLKNALRVLEEELSLTCFITSDTEIIAPSESGLPPALLSFSPDGEGEVQIPDSDYKCRICRLGTGSENAYFVCATRDEKFSELVTMATDRIIQVLSLEYGQLLALKKLQSRYRTRFLAEWLTGAYSSAGDIEVSAEAYGIKVPSDGIFRAAVISGVRAGHSAMDRLEHALSHCGRTYYPVFNDSHAVIIMQSESEDSAADAAELLEALEGMSELHGFRLCLSDRAGAAEIPEQYKQARRICAISEKCSLEGRLLTGQELGIYEILSLLPHDRTVDKFVEKFIAPLKAYDSAHGSDLLGTLRCYYSCASNTKAAADKLFTHYNTVCYRLERIKQILGMDIDDVDTRFQIQTAMILYKINGNSKKEEKNERKRREPDS